MNALRNHLHLGGDVLRDGGLFLDGGGGGAHGVGDGFCRLVDGAGALGGLEGHLLEDADFLGDIYR